MVATPSRTFRQNFVEFNKTTYGRYENSNPKKLLLLRKRKQISRQREQREEELFRQKFFHIYKWRINKYYETILTKKVEELKVRETTLKQWLTQIKVCALLNYLFEKSKTRKIQKAVSEQKMIRACYIKTCIKIALKYYRKSKHNRALHRLNSGIIQTNHIYSKLAYSKCCNILAVSLKFNQDISRLKLHCSLYIQKIYRIQQQWKKVMELNTFRRNMLIERWELRKNEMYKAYYEKGKKYAGVCRKLTNLSPEIGKQIMTDYFNERKAIYLKSLSLYFQSRNRVSLEKKRAFNAISKMSASPPDKKVDEVLLEEKRALYASKDLMPIVPLKPRRSSRFVNISIPVHLKPEKKKEQDWKKIPDFIYQPSLSELTNKIRLVAGIQ